MVTIRLGNTDDFISLDWAWGDDFVLQAEYASKIRLDEQEFWVAVEGDRLIGEIHVVWDDADAERANGHCRAYLSTFRIHLDFQRQGYGLELIGRAITSIKERGCTEITIGAYLNEPEIQELYRQWGFDRELKVSRDTSAPGDPEFVLFLRELENQV
jgi:ribosomal protein S18 acetylase RimI-like enzyme